MTETSQSSARTSVATEAADWYARLRAPDVSEIEAVRFRAWLAGDPERRREFDAIDAFWQDLAAIEHAPEVTRVQEGLVVRPPRDKQWRGYLAKAASVLVAVGIAWGGWEFWTAGHYSTGIGEQRMVPLEDGSVVTLNTSTEIRLHYSKGVREVTLLHGQANFDVAKDPNRPFIVAAGGGEVRAVGTVFDVYKSGDKVTVTLIEGRVVVTPDRTAPAVHEQLVSGAAAAMPPPASSEVVMDAGEQLSFAPVSEVMKVPAPVEVASVDIPRATAWRERKLDFSDTPVLEAIAEANRYSREQIVLDAPQFMSARISGTFEAGKNDAFVEGLQTYFRLNVVRDDRRIILTNRRPEAAR